ncbi:MAG: response regulator [Bdellovibrionota bacterium]
MTDYDILVVDDENDITEILSKILKLAGYKVATASSAAEALSYLEASVPPLIICDISMPEKSGLDLVQDIRFKNFPCAVVMLTAHSEKERIIEALRLGATDYLIKPFDSEKLLENVALWIQVGERVGQLTSVQDNAKKLLRINYMKLKNNMDRKKSG